MKQAFTKVIDLLYLAKRSGVDIILNNDSLQLKLPKNGNIDNNLLEQIRNNKQLLIDFLRSRKKADKNYNKISRFDRGTINHIPLSFSQERLWFIHQLEGSVEYHLPAVLRLKGKLDKEALTHTLQSIIERHEVLRTVIEEEEGKPYQHIGDKDG